MAKIPLATTRPRKEPILWPYIDKAGIASDKQVVQWTFVLSVSPWAELRRLLCEFRLRIRGARCHQGGVRTGSVSHKSLNTNYIDIMPAAF